jgi:hypothetical protein
MTINIPLTEAEEAQLREQAAQRAILPEELAAELVRSGLGPSSENGEGGGYPRQRVMPVVDENGVFHPERMEAVHEHLCRLTKGKPSIPLEALRREALYEDHD